MYARHLLILDISKYKLRHSLWPDANRSTQLLLAMIGKSVHEHLSRRRRSENSSLRSSVQSEPAAALTAIFRQNVSKLYLDIARESFAPQRM